MERAPVQRQGTIFLKGKPCCPQLHVCKVQCTKIVPFDTTLSVHDKVWNEEDRNYDKGASWSLLKGSESKQCTCPNPQATEGTHGGQLWPGAKSLTRRWEQIPGPTPLQEMSHFCSWAAADYSQMHLVELEVLKVLSQIKWFYDYVITLSSSQFKVALKCSAVKCSSGKAGI